jgi:hypothetical protein
MKWKRLEGAPHEGKSVMGEVEERKEKFLGGSADSRIRVKTFSLNPDGNYEQD